MIKRDPFESGWHLLKPKRQPKTEKPFVKLWLDTVFLQRLQRYLSPTEDEESVILAGISAPRINGRILIPTSPFMPDYRAQSVGGVEATPESMLRIDRKLAACGLEKIARAHSHPFKGIGACTPSRTDTGDQEAFEAAGYLIPSMIFTRVQFGSFFVRVFMSDRLRLGVQVYGKAVMREKNVYEIPQEHH